MYLEITRTFVYLVEVENVQEAELLQEDNESLEEVLSDEIPAVINLDTRILTDEFKEIDDER